MLLEFLFREDGGNGIFVVLRKDPTRDQWSFEERLEDVIVLNTREKFSPATLEP